MRLWRLLRRPWVAWCNARGYKRFLKREAERALAHFRAEWDVQP